MTLFDLIMLVSGGGGHPRGDGICLMFTAGVIITGLMILGGRKLYAA